jgi:hypothetical protein
MARMGLSAAALCAEAKGAIREDMSYQLLINKINEFGGESV